MKARRNREFLLLLGVAACLTLLFVLGCARYRVQSATSLPPLTSQLGTLALAEGLRSHAAGELEVALGHYRRALAGNMAGPQDRVHAETRCGIVLWELGRYGEALPHLERAVASPLRRPEAYRPLVDCLVAAGRMEEAEAAARQWLDAGDGDTKSRADALHALGKVSIARADIDAARQHFEAALALAPGHAAALNRAKLHDIQGERADAITVLAEWLSTAPPGKGAEAGWAMLNAWGDDPAR